MDKIILVIDDDDQKDELRLLEAIARKRGINLTCLQFNVGSPNEPELLTNGHIDIAKVKAAYTSRFKDKGYVFNMVVCDWGLSDAEIDGAELMRRMGNDCFSPKTPKVLYSGLLNEKVEEILNRYDPTNNVVKEQIIKYLVSLFNLNYLAFVERGRVRETVLGHLKDDENLDFLLEDTLMKYPDKVMAVGHNHSLEGKTFAEVARLLRSDEVVRYDFKRDLIQEVMDYLLHNQSK